MVGRPDDTSFANARAELGSASATLIALTTSASAGSSDGVASAIKSGRCMRASIRSAVKRIGSG
ncbi:MAG TPA: hypothetical protein VFF43_13735, partial [Caldimonas sp.]|nr:hypothetical protein [Caldimonas sp.]